MKHRELLTAAADFLAACGFEGDPGDVSRIETTPSKVVITHYRRNEQGRFFVVDGDIATETTVLKVGTDE